MRILIWTLTIMKYDYNSIKWDDILYYDESSPTCLRWKQHRKGYGNATNKNIGDVAGTLSYKNSRKSYTKISIAYNKKHYIASRIIWTLFNGDIDTGMIIDHINGDSVDNRISNLKLTTFQGNSTNTRKRDSNKTGVVGVSKNSQIGGYNYYEACYQYIDNGKLVRKRKLFSIDKLGEESAFTTACKWRYDGIEYLKTIGIPYTDRHGK